MGSSVVVVGSGGAGLAAALAAASAGADVVVLERAGAVGGTTAISGGVVWAPGNAFCGDRDAEDAVTYVQSISRGDVDRALLEMFVLDAARVMTLLEERTPLCWAPLADWPDYHSELPGGRDGGRSVWPAPLPLRGSVAVRVQRPFAHDGEIASHASPRTTNDGVVFRGPVRGQALVGGLLGALDDLGVEIRTGVRVERLTTDRDGVTGVEASGEAIQGRVVLASGGFQHDPALRAAFLPGTAIAPMGTPGCAGDGLRMAMGAGSDLGNMTEGWWMPALSGPGEQLDGAAHHRPLHSERAQPGAILVDRAGRRFVNEAQNYCDVGRAMQRFDAGTGTYPASPCWLVFDARYRATYPLGPLEPGGSDPEWLQRADDLESLGARLCLPRGALTATVGRFNAGAVQGDDPDFGRGSRHYDRWIGDATAPHPTLAALVDPPFYAAEVTLGCMGTKGGPRTDDRGRVLPSGGQAQPGLYAAGNVAASPFGIGTPAGGGTIGPALVFGTRAGEAAAGDGGRR